MRTRRPCAAPAVRSAFAGFRFPPDVIVVAVRWYLRFGLSYRDVEELLAERGVEVDHVTITGGCSGSRRCWPRLPGRAGTPSATAGRSIRPTSRWPVGGATSTERSTSSGRSSTCSDPHSAMPRPHAGASNRPSARPGSPRSRSSPIRRQPTRSCGTSCSPRRGIVPTSTPTTVSRPITAG
jgi:hypothetical protein